MLSIRGQTVTISGFAALQSLLQLLNSAPAACEKPRVYSERATLSSNNTVFNKNRQQAGRGQLGFADPSPGSWADSI